MQLIWGNSTSTILRQQGNPASSCPSLPPWTLDNPVKFLVVSLHAFVLPQPIIAHSFTAAPRTRHLSLMTIAPITFLVNRLFIASLSLDPLAGPLLALLDSRVIHTTGTPQLSIDSLR